MRPRSGSSERWWATAGCVPRTHNPKPDAPANAALDNTGGVKPACAYERKPVQKNVVDDSRSESRASTSAPRKVRAHYRDGVLVPADPLNLQEGAVVEISVALVPGQN